jgi:hypothetical protein
MKMRFKNEKVAREQTIGRAVAIARAAVEIVHNPERNQVAVPPGLSDRAARKIDLLLTAAEALRLGDNIPREPRALIAWVSKPARRKAAPIDLQAEPK